MIKSRWSMFFLMLSVMVTIAIFANPAVLAEPAELTLEECLELALKMSPLVKTAEADLEIAREQEKEARSGKLPWLSYLGTAERGKTETAGTTNKFGNRLQLDCPLYSGGQTEGRIEQAALYVKVSEGAVKRAKLQVGIDVTEAYCRMVLAENEWALAEESGCRLREHLSHVQALYGQGIAARIDLIRVEIENATAGQRLISVEKSRRSASAALNSLIGRALNSPVVVRGVLDSVTLTEPLEYYLEQAAAQRPELIQAQLGVEIAEKNLLVTQSGYYPIITLTGTVDRYDSHMPGFGNGDWSVGVSAQWNIYDGGRARSRVEQALAEIEKARENQRQVKNQIELEITEAYLGLQEADQLLKNAETMVGKAEEEYKIARVGYEAGFETSLNVLGYHETFIKVKANYLQIKADCWLRRFNLLKAAGIL